MSVLAEEMMYLPVARSRSVNEEENQNHRNGGAKHVPGAKEPKDGGNGDVIHAQAHPKGHGRALH